MNKLSLIYLVRFFFICSFIFAQGILSGIGQTKSEKLDALFEKYHEYNQFNGSVLIVDNGQIIYKKGFGWANMEWEIPNDSQTKHRLGSITKQFTAMLILQLMEDGKLKLDDSIIKHIPDYPKENGNQVTIHQLLIHTSGIPSYTSYGSLMRDKSRNAYTPDEFIHFFADSTLQFKPGTQFRYNNSGYFLLGVIVEKITGKTYEEALKERIFDPLGMKNTGFDHHNTILKNRASGYEKRGGEFINANYLDMSIPYAAGSLYSTVEDLFLWDQALYTNKLLSKESMNLFFTDHYKFGNRHYAYGWSVGEQKVGNTDQKVRTVAHGGGINGFNTIITRFPNDKHLIVLLNNTGGTILNEINLAITGILYESSYDMPKKSLATVLFKIIMKENLEAGINWFKENKNSKIFALKENEFNRIGYQLLQSGKTKEAIAVFKINVDSFPDSSNVYDSLGEAYFKDGQTDLAIKNYKKSLELNPNNNNAVEYLKKLEKM